MSTLNKKEFCIIIYLKEINTEQVFSYFWHFFKSSLFSTKFASCIKNRQSLNDQTSKSNYCRIK